MQKKLTKLQAYNVMLFFLKELYEQESLNYLNNELSDSKLYLGDILSNSEFWTDGIPGDRGTWSDWKKAIKTTVSQDEKIRNYNKFTFSQACNLMFNYIDNYVSFYEPKPIYLINLLNKLELLRKKQDQKMWKKWLCTANIVVKMNDPRCYLKLEQSNNAEKINRIKNSNISF